MALKGTDPILAKIGDDEPVFVLRAKDALAPGIVRAWVEAAMDAGVSLEKVAEARNLAHLMERWQETHGSKTPD